MLRFQLNLSLLYYYIRVTADVDDEHAEIAWEGWSSEDP
jgi:hypothetical protein